MIDRVEIFERCSSSNIKYDINALKQDIENDLYGQHIVNASLIPALRSHINNLELSRKPLVMSFHGTPGIAMFQVIKLNKNRKMFNKIIY